MSDQPSTKTPADLTLERQNRLGREMDALRETVGSLTRMFALQNAGISAQLDRIEGRIAGLDQTVKGYASEQLALANALLNVQQEVSRAHRRLDEAETG